MRFALFRRISGLALGFVTIVLGPVVASGQVREVQPPLLLGGAIQPEKSPVRLDPVLPRGALRSFASKVPLLKGARCSLARPVCVRVGAADAPRALRWLERAFEEVTFGASLPPSGFTFEEPLVWDAEGRGSTLVVQTEKSFSRLFDRGLSTCRGGRLTPEVARRCVMGALVGAHAPATAPWLEAGFAAFWAEGLGEAPETGEARRGSLAHPEIGVLTSSVHVDGQQGRAAFTVSPLRSARLFDHLERRSREAFGGAGYLALTLAATRTPAGAPRFEAEPDLFDVLSVTLRGDRTEVARFFDDFAQTSFFGAVAAKSPIEPDWVIPGASLPRSVAFSRTLEPTGSVYLRVDLPPAMRSDVIGFRVSCEAPVSYVWSVARLGEREDELSRMPFTYRQRGGDASGRVLPVPGQVALLLAGTNLDGVDLAHPFDPDHGPHESHGCSVAIDVVPGEPPAP